MNFNTNKKVSDIMTFDVIVAESDDSLKDVAVLMKENDIGFLPIIAIDTLIGVVTDRDMVVRGYAQGLAEDSKISEVMTHDFISIPHNATVEKAAKIMSEHQIRRVCVTENNKLVGICAIGDIATTQGVKAEARAALTHISKPDKPIIYI